MSTLVILKVDPGGTDEPEIEFICLTRSEMPDTVWDPDDEVKLIARILEQAMDDTKSKEVTVWNVGRYSHTRIYPPVPGQRD